MHTVDIYKCIIPAERVYSAQICMAVAMWMQDGKIQVKNLSDYESFTNVFPPRIQNAEITEQLENFTCDRYRKTSLILKANLKKVSVILENSWFGLGESYVCWGISTMFSETDTPNLTCNEY